MYISTATYEESSESLPLLHRSESIPDLDSKLKSSRALLIEAVGCVPKSSARFVKKFFTKSHHSQKNTPIAIRVLAQSAEGIAGGLLFLSACSASILWVCNPLAWGLKIAHLRVVNSRIAYLISITESDITNPSSQKELLKHQKEYWKILTQLRPKKNLANYCVLNSDKRNKQLDEFSRILTRRLSLHIDLANLLTKFEETCENNKTSIPTCSHETLALWVKCSQIIEQELQNPTLGYDNTLLTTWERLLTRNGGKCLTSVLNQLKILNKQSIADLKKRVNSAVRNYLLIESELVEKTLRYDITEILVGKKQQLASELSQLKIPNIQDPTKLERNAHVADHLRTAQWYAELLNHPQIFKQHIDHIRESLEAKSSDRIDQTTSEGPINSNGLRLLPQPIESFDKELSSLQWKNHNLLVQSLLLALIEREIPFSVDEWKEVVQSLESLPTLNPDESEFSDIMQFPYLNLLQELCNEIESKMLEKDTNDRLRLYDVSSVCYTFFSLEKAIPRLQNHLLLISTTSSTQDDKQSSLKSPLEKKDLITQRLYCVMQQMSSFRERYLVLFRKYIRASFDIWNAQMWSNIWDSILEKQGLLSSLNYNLTHLPSEESASGPTELELTTGLFTVIATMNKVDDMCTRDPQELLEMFKIPIANMRKVCPEFPKHVLLLGNSPLSPEEKSKLRIRIIQNFFKNKTLSSTSLAKAKTELMSQLHLDPTDSMTQELDLAFTCETKMLEYFASITQ